VEVGPVEKEVLVVLPLQPEEAESVADFRLDVVQWFFADYIMDVRRDRWIAGALEDGPELEIVTVTGGKSDAIKVRHLVAAVKGPARYPMVPPVKWRHDPGDDSDT
jgi:hypothetical protein